MSNGEEINDMLTPTQAAERLGVSPRLVQKMCREARIPCYKVGGRYRIKPEDLQNLIKKIGE